MLFTGIVSVSCTEASEYLFVGAVPNGPKVDRGGLCVGSSQYRVHTS